MKRDHTAVNKMWYSEVQVKSGELMTRSPTVFLSSQPQTLWPTGGISQELGKESLSPPAYFAGVNGFYLLAACCVLSNGGGGLKQSLSAQWSIQGQFCWTGEADHKMTYGSTDMRLKRVSNPRSHSYLASFFLQHPVIHFGCHQTSLGPLLKHHRDQLVQSK